jgi:hypothetical protein
LVPPTSLEASAPADVLYLNEARAARQRVRIFDDLRDFG